MDNQLANHLIQNFRPLPSLNCNDIMEFLYNRIEIKRPDILKLVPLGPIPLSKIIKVGWSDDSGFRTRVWRHIEHDTSEMF